jgi:2-polyprenyl-3-methyl-5-hydroxy-6-metoxy-1,4-benzoquinol methylase
MKTNWTKYWKKYETLAVQSKIWRVKRAYKNLMKDISLKSPKILELGSGSGINSLLMARILDAKEITLVDSNKEAIEISKKLFENSDLDVKYLRRDVLSLDLNEKFDIVHSEGLNEHFYGDDRMAIFKKHVDLCKKEGFIIIFVPYESVQYTLFKWCYLGLNKWVYDEEPFSKQELHELCEQFGLKIQKEFTNPLLHEIGILAKKF